MIDALLAQVSPAAQQDFFTGLGNNGPWAAMAGLLVWQLIKERAADRDERIRFFGSVNDTLAKLGTAVDNLAKEQKENSALMNQMMHHFKEIPE